MNDDAHEPRLKSTGKSAKKRRRGVVEVGDEGDAEDEDEEIEIRPARDDNWIHSGRNYGRPFLVAAY
jgi:hypothetical protein